eukprot:GEMP01030562.1.p1 GENE.GEMP01030562.1~~GEMP01030562.1.p1  ORF type:complete len:192 (-),score=31.24 GEMP01030562.1:1491-2066(-)
MIRLFFLAATASGLFFSLKGGATECFGFSLPPDGGLKLLGSYETSGAQEGILVLVKSDKDKTEVYRSIHVSSKIETSQEITGEYQLCFTSSVPNEQTVSFNLHIDKAARNIVTTTQTDKVQSLVSELEVRTSTIMDQQQYAITREAVHRDTAESTNSRLVWWTAIEVGCLIFLAGFQVYYLKSFFEVKVHV